MRSTVLACLLILAAATAPAAANPRVAFETSLGRVVLEVYPEKAPQTVENFLRYVSDGHYDGTIFHRLVPDFVVQGGGHLPDGTEKPTREPIKNEADNGLLNTRGSVAMARETAPDSATAQFYVNLRHNRILDHGVRDFGYAVFGQVVEGLAVVDAMASSPTTTAHGQPNWPVAPVVVFSARIL